MIRKIFHETTNSARPAANQRWIRSKSSISDRWHELKIIFLYLTKLDQMSNLLNLLQLRESSEKHNKKGQGTVQGGERPLSSELDSNGGNTGASGSPSAGLRNKRAQRLACAVCAPHRARATNRCETAAWLEGLGRVQCDYVISQTNISPTDISPTDISPTDISPSMSLANWTH